MEEKETEIIYHVDEEETPYLVKLAITPDEVTLADFKNVFKQPNYQFFFQTMHDDLGVIKKQIIHDDAHLPCFNGRVVSWVKKIRTAADIDLIALQNEVKICREYMAAIFVGECANNVLESINNLTRSEQDQLFKYCKMNDTEIKSLREELGVHTKNRHCFAHLGSKDTPENKIKKFHIDTLKQGMADLESSKIQEIEMSLQQINFRKENSVFEEV